MTITITGCEITPQWETIQEVIRESTQTKGKLIRISKVTDLQGVNNVDYRSLGKYFLTYCHGNDAISVTLNTTR